MDFGRLEVLEDKIKKMLAAMKSLQAENEQLNRKNSDNEKTIAKLKHDLERWSKSADETETLQQQMETLRGERDQIKGKVENLISHLEDLEAQL